MTHLGFSLVLTDSPLPSSSQIDKVAMAQRLRAETTMTLQWIARRLQMGTRTHLAHFKGTITSLSLEIWWLSRPLRKKL